MEYQNFKSDVLATGIDDDDTSATLSSGNFTAFTDGYLVFDYDNPTKREIIRCSVSGTAVTSMTRAQEGTSATSHAAGAKIIWALHTAHLNQLADGWILANESWSYASATTITVPSGATSKYAVGDKIKITQTTVKYFYITAVASTTLTVTGGSDYTVANAPITDNYYSRAVSPVGFPQWFNWTPTWGGFSPNPTATCRFNIFGRKVNFYISTTAAGTSSATTTSFTLPIAASTNMQISAGSIIIFAYDDTGGSQNISRGLFGTTSRIDCYLTAALGNWTNGGAKYVQVPVTSYEI